MKHCFKIQLYGDPDVDVREVMPSDSDDIIKDKNRWPFMARQRAFIKVFYNGEWFAINNKPNYKYDGATIPFKIGKGNMKLLVPALYHDIICEDKTKVNQDRYLSSLIFRELLIQCHVNKLVAYGMFLVVDTFQRTQRGWKK